MINAAQKNIVFFQRSISLSEGGVPRVSDIISKELTNRDYNCYFIYYQKDNDEYPGDMKLKVNMEQPYKMFEDSVLQFIKRHNINIFVCQNADSFPFIRLYKHIRLLYPSFPFLRFLHASPDYWQMSYRLKTDSFTSAVSFSQIKNFVKKIVYSIYHPYVRKTAALYKICDRFILLSDSFKDSFIKIYSIDKSTDKLITIPNPLTFTNAAACGELKKKEKIILIVSRLDEHQKRISSALKIWQEVALNHDDWKLIIVGSGPDEDFYKTFVTKNSIKNVLFTGHKLNVIDYYQKASIFMMTSIWEGLPMSILEAQQNGVVPLAFDNFSALHDVISDGENGYIIQNNNTKHFAAKLSNLMQNEDIRHKMACKSIISSQRYNISSIANEWEAVFKVYAPAI